jgi:hypothetical protein
MESRTQLLGILEWSVNHPCGNLKLTDTAVFNNTLYMILTASFILRMVALSHTTDSDPRIHYNVLSYDFLAFAAPFFWLRILLYLDTYRFFGVRFDS